MTMVLSACLEGPKGPGGTQERTQRRAQWRTHQKTLQSIAVVDACMMVSIAIKAVANVSSVESGACHLLSPPPSFSDTAMTLGGSAVVGLCIVVSAPCIT